MDLFFFYRRARTFAHVNNRIAVTAVVGVVVRIARILCHIAYSYAVPQ